MTETERTPLAEIERTESGGPGNRTVDQEQPQTTTLVGRWGYLVPFALFIFICIAYVPSLDGAFVHWDDSALLFTHENCQRFAPENIRWMFTTTYGGHFQPLTWLTYAIDWQLAGPYPFMYHLTSVVFHALTAVAFYFLVRQLLAVGFGRYEDRQEAGTIGAAVFATLLFALHPLRAESVAWVAERRDVVSGLFFVLSVACYVKYAARRAERREAAGSQIESFVEPGQHPRETVFYWGSILLCAVSLLAKASAMTLAFVLLILDAYPLRRFSKAHRTDRDSISLILTEKVPFLALGMAAGAVAVWAQQQGGALETLASHDIPSRLAQSSYGLVFYIWKTLWPANLGPLYEIPPKSALFGPMLWISLAALTVIVVTVIRLGRRYPALPAAFAAYVVVLGPTLGLFQSGRQLVADRYSYLSCLGWTVLASAILLAHFRGRFSFSDRNRYASGAIVATLLVALLGRAGFAQQDIWLGPLQLWSHGVAVNPGSAIAHVNYADALVVIEDYDLAVEHYRRGLEINPHDVIAWHHLARIQRRLGRYDSAIYSYIQTLKRDPGRRGAHLPLARLLIGAERPQQAIAVLKDGARQTPEETGITYLLADMLATHPADEVRDGQAALSWAEKLLDAWGHNDPAALMVYASALAEAGRCEEALETARQAKEIAGPLRNGRLTHEIDRRLKSFEKGEPYHDPFGE
ncbi:MAG: tetratricopeptide repeat protein [Phycisphaerales bacterium]|nr:MAG: tetratricopeptide repeat protein [Phycisphaerales bacterium]